jgi:hypothetical protein
VNSSGQLFQFTLTNKMQLRLLRVGSGVYANFGSHQISLDGRTIAGNIIGASPAPVAPAANSRPPLNSIPPIAGATQRPAAPLDGAKVGATPAAPLDGAKVGVTSAAPLDGATAGGNPAAPLDGVRVNAAAPLDGAKLGATPAAPLDGAKVGVTSAAPLDGATAGGNSAAPLDGVRVNAAAPLDGAKLGATPAAPLDGAKVGVTSAAPLDGATAGGNSAAPLDGVRVNAAAPLDGAKATSQLNPACCQITGINSSTGIVTARVNATGQVFQFSANSATVHQLHVGQGVFANFKFNRISLDGQHVNGTIVAKGAVPTGPTNAPNSGNTPPAGTLAPQRGNLPPNATPASLGNEVSKNQCAAGEFRCCSIGKDGTSCRCLSVKNRGECSLTVRPPDTSNVNWNANLGLGRGSNDGSGTGSGQVPPQVLQSCTQTCNAQGQATNPPQSCSPVVQQTSNGSYSCSCNCIPSGPMPSTTPAGTNSKGGPILSEKLGDSRSDSVSQNGNSTNSGWDIQNNASAATSSGTAVRNAISPDRTRNNGDKSKNDKGGTQPLSPNLGAAQQFALPQLTAGALQYVQNVKTPSPTSVRERRLPNASLVQIRGIDEIDKTSAVSQAVKDFLLLHARTLPEGEIDHYAVNTQLAEQWFATHPEPEAVKQAAAKARSSTHAGCHSLSTHCASEAAKHAEGEAERQVGKLLQQAQDEWKHVTHEATNDWHQVEGCFVDHTLSLPNVPVSFTTTPGFPISINKSGSSKNQYGSASGSVSGTATFGVPITPDFNVDLEVFYVPCMPYMIRPKSIETDGTLQVGGVFQANLNATGQFNQQFTIPPGGGPHFPIAVLPLALGPVPIAELDLSVYVDGTLAVDGNGSLNGAVQMQAFHKTAFDLLCNGHGCDLKSHNIPVPDSAAESVKMQGVLHVRPAVYAALQLDFDIDALTVRAGPEPYLLGEIYGCSATSASQNSATGNSTQELYALTADLDWGIDLRAEALVGNDKVGEHKWDLTKGHILFKDLANSNALIPALAGPAQGGLGQAALFNVKMPACYPYHDEVEYRAQWTGGATASAPAPTGSTMKATIKPAGLPLGPMQRPTATGGTASSCTIQSGEADCWNNPSAATALDLAWPSAGAYSVTVIPVRDKHGRVFNTQAAQTNITIQ